MVMKAAALWKKKKGRGSSHGQDSSYFLGWEEYERNPYHPVTNPSGIIQMGLAENQLSFDLLESWLAANPKAATFERDDGSSAFRELALFQDYHGFPDFKRALCDFMAEIRGNRVSFDHRNLVLTAGATSANETLMFCLAAPGEAFLLPTPYYPGFDRDLKWRTGVEIVPVVCESSNKFRITRHALEESYRRARRLNLRVRGVLITNPSNPLGTAVTWPELDALLDFAAAKRVHLISDEIYAGTVFGGDFVSVMEAVAGRGDAVDLAERVHVVCSLSKDLGLPGFRVGAIYSSSRHVVTTATKMSSFGLISSQTQHLLSRMLSDAGFVRDYNEKNRARLKRRHGLLVAGLKEAGIGCLESNAGLFCWVDMMHLLGSTGNFEGERKLWEKVLYEVGLNISPGSSCHCTEPGWFRVCFANMEEEALGVAMRRIKTFVSSRRDLISSGGSGGGTTASTSASKGWSSCCGKRHILHF